MRIAMFTNTYVPHVGGVARSVEQLSLHCRRRGHRVLVVAPEYDQQPAGEQDVVRVSALRNFNGSDFSVVLPRTSEVTGAIRKFKPEVIHSHHPFFLGDTALRLASESNVPLVFTYHTMYEHYAHYIPLKMDMLSTYLIKLAVGYANLCDGVVAPSESVEDILRQRGVDVPIEVIPTGVELQRFFRGDGPAFRARMGIPPESFLIGHVGRLAPEKNLEWLAEAVAEALRRLPQGRFLLVGSGPSQTEMARIFRRAGVADRVHEAGRRVGQELIDAYHAMDLFAFASKSETQGMVLVEALAAGCPIVALDAPGAREVVRDGVNGKLLSCEEKADFAEAAVWAAAQDRALLCLRAIESAQPFAVETCLEKMVDFYHDTLARERRCGDIDGSEWSAVGCMLRNEWHLWSGRVKALATAVTAHGDASPGGRQ